MVGLGVKKREREVNTKTGGAKDKVEGRRKKGENKGGRCEVSLPVVPSL